MVLANATAVILLKYINVSNQHVVRLKLHNYVNYISIKHLKKRYRRLKYLDQINI